MPTHLSVPAHFVEFLYVDGCRGCGAAAELLHHLVLPVLGVPAQRGSRQSIQQTNAWGVCGLLDSEGIMSLCFALLANVMRTAAVTSVFGHSDSSCIYASLDRPALLALENEQVK